MPGICECVATVNREHPDTTRHTPRWIAPLRIPATGEKAEAHMHSMSVLMPSLQLRPARACTISIIHGVSGMASPTRRAEGRSTRIMPMRYITRERANAHQIHAERHASSTSTWHEVTQHARPRHHIIMPHHYHHTARSTRGQGHAFAGPVTARRGLERKGIEGRVPSPPTPALTQLER